MAKNRLYMNVYVTLFQRSVVYILNGCVMSAIVLMPWTTMVSTIFEMGAVLVCGAMMVQKPMQTTTAGAYMNGNIFRANCFLFVTSSVKKTISSMKVHIV